MENLNFIAQLEELTAQEDVLSVSRDVNDLRGKFDDYVLEEERKFQVLQLEAEEKGETVPELDHDFGKEAFFNVYNVYKEKCKAAIDARNAMESENLKKKRALIARLQNIVSTEENIGAAFAAFKEIQDQWQEVGDIPRDKRSDIQSEYSKLLEDFFYNINIYKQLKDHDFHRNQQLKLEVIEQLKKLQKEESVKTIESELKRYQNEWDAIGPVPNNAWELLKESYWTEVRSLYNRLNRHYEDIREEQKANLDKKQALLAEVQAVVVGMGEYTERKEWEAGTETVIDIQNRWKQVGFGPKKENEEIWKEFRGVCDQFFDAKKGFYNEINSKFDAVAEKKQALVDKANALKTSTDWKETSNQLIQLQKQWKEMEHAGLRNEQKLWKNFRTACDAFFNARQKHFEIADKEFEDNLTLKEELIKKIESYEASADKSQTLADLRQFSADFNAIGKVPMKSKDTVYQAFKAGMDKHYGALKMEGAEKDKVMFEARIQTLKASPNSGRLIEDTKADIRKEMDKYTKEIQLLDNNLGFFSNSKGAEALKKDVEKKIKQAQDKVDALRRKLKMIPNE